MLEGVFNGIDLIGGKGIAIRGCHTWLSEKNTFFGISIFNFMLGHVFCRKMFKQYQEKNKDKIAERSRERYKKKKESMNATEIVDE